MPLRQSFRSGNASCPTSVGQVSLVRAFVRVTCSRTLQTSPCPCPCPSPSPLTPSSCIHFKRVRTPPSEYCQPGPGRDHGRSCAGFRRRPGRAGSRSGELVAACWLLAAGSRLLAIGHGQCERVSADAQAAFDQGAVGAGHDLNATLGGAISGQTIIIKQVIIQQLADSARAGAGAGAGAHVAGLVDGGHTASALTSVAATPISTAVGASHSSAAGA